jgi:predicted dehydrogenase
MKITPVFLGSGRAAHAILKSLTSLEIQHPEFQFHPPVWMKRGEPLRPIACLHENPILIIANPHGLHAAALIEADSSGFQAILCEKPAAVNSQEVEKLRLIKTPTAVFHVYRQTWGIQTLREMIRAEDFGKIITIEGRYWQSSSAERGLALSVDGTSTSWKNNTQLSGEYDVFLDIGTHWIDTASFLQGEFPVSINGWRSYVNAETPHRDSHNQITVEFPNGSRAFGSISKAFHGATNHFEVNVIGEKKSATWEFLKADEISFGEGRDRRIMVRKDSTFGSQQSPFHGVGWIEGYIEISYQLLREVFFKQKSNYPTLPEQVKILEAMLRTSWN